METPKTKESIFDLGIFYGSLRTKMTQWWSFEQHLCDFTGSSELFELDTDDTQDQTGPAGHWFFISVQWRGVRLARSWPGSCQAGRGGQGCRVTLKTLCGSLGGVLGSPPWAPLVAQRELTWRRWRPKERNAASHLEVEEGLNGKIPIWRVGFKLSHFSWWFWASAAKKFCRTSDFKKILGAGNRALHIPLPKFPILQIVQTAF